MSNRVHANEVIDLCKRGELNPIDVLENLLLNYLTADTANAFAEDVYALPK